MFEKLEETTPIFMCVETSTEKNDTNISVVGKYVLKLMNSVFYLILKIPSSYLWDPERYIMQPISICMVPVDKMRSLLI